MVIHFGGYIMKKQYLIIGLAGLMASNAVSTSYGNNDFDNYYAKYGDLMDDSVEKPGFYARHSTLIKTVGGVAVAGALGVVCYKLNQSGKLNPDAVKATLKSLVSKAGDLKSKIGSKMSSLFTRSSNSVNNTLVNQTMPNTTMCDINGNKSQEIVWPFDSKPVEVKPVVAPKIHSNISLFNKNRTKFQEIAKNISSPILYGYFVPNAKSPKNFIITKPPVDVQNGGSMFNTYVNVKTRGEVLHKVKNNIASFFSRIFRK